MEKDRGGEENKKEKRKKSKKRDKKKLERKGRKRKENKECGCTRLQIDKKKTDWGGVQRGRSLRMPSRQDCA